MREIHTLKHITYKHTTWYDSVTTVTTTCKGKNIEHTRHTRHTRHTHGTKDTEKSAHRMRGTHDKDESSKMIQ
jgi:hypothetical protein